MCRILSKDFPFLQQSILKWESCCPSILKQTHIEATNNHGLQKVLAELGTKYDKGI